MLTPADIRNPKRASGFNHVSFTGSKSHPLWRAVVAPGRRGASDAKHRGPGRKRPEEAAQDYCDYMNSQPPLTIEDIRNPARKSGFEHVNKMERLGSPLPPKPYRGYGRAIQRPGVKYANEWLGPARATAAEAAQDYVDYVNAQRGPQSRVVIAPDKLRFPRHPRKVRTTAGVKAVPRRGPSRSKEGPGWVYCLGMIGNDAAVKVGESSDEAEFRLNGLQTGNPYELYVIWSFYTETRIADEADLHAKWVKHQTGTVFVGEWFARVDEIITYKPTGTRTGRMSCATPNLNTKPAPMARDANTKEALAA